MRETPSLAPMAPTTARLRAGGTAGEVSALRSSADSAEHVLEAAQLAQQLVRVHT